ncbi:MAG: hypothetical protein Q9182_003494 [Xanthomendoza sp. 2 TL-2023]
MALDLQIGFRPRRAPSDESTPTASPRPSFSRDNSSNATTAGPESSRFQFSNSSSQIDLSATPSSPSLGTDDTARWLASARQAAHASIPPIGEEATVAGEAEEQKEKIDKTSFQSDAGQPISSLDRYLKNRTTSISLDPQAKFEQRYQAALEEPLPKLAVSSKLRIRTVQDISSGLNRSPLSRAYSESYRTRPDSHTAQQKDLQSQHPHNTFKIHPYLDLSSPVEVDSRHRGFPDIQASGSLTSNSTASSGVPEARTPIDDKMETCVISPVTAFPPFYQPTSYESTSAWPKPRRRLTSASRSLGHSIESRTTRRQGSTNPRRSTSSAMSPATAFLSRFAREEAIVEPDGEGQEMGEYILGKQIGFGGFSVVREAFTIEGDERVVRAVKIVRKQVAGKEDLENEQLQAEFEHEVNLWRCLGHRHILPLIAVHVDNYATYCFTKLNTGGTLFDLIRNNRQGISQDLVRRYSYQLASAVRYLHEDMHIVHRDIKLENCLIDVSLENAARDGGNLLLCDFGLAEFTTNDNGRYSPDPYDAAADRPKPKAIGPSDTSTSIAGSLQYASPELIMSPAGFLSPVVDVWAFGVVVYSLLVGQLPFQHTFQPRVQAMILAGEWNEGALKKAKGSQGMEDEVLDIIHGCLDMNSEERWDIAQILKSGWLKGCQEILEEISEQWKL